MLKHIQDYLLRIAYASVKDFLDYIGHEGEAMIGYTNSYGQELDDCIQITDDMGQAVFLIFVDDFDKGTYNGVMAEDHKAPGSHENFRLKYMMSDASPIALCRWALGLDIKLS